MRLGLREAAGTVREWGEDFGRSSRSGSTPAAFGVRGHPSTVLIDRDGRIVGRVPGERNWGSPDARRLVEWLLEQGRGDDQSTR